MKLVIASHIKYNKAIEVLFESLKKIDFKWYSEIIIVYAGCAEDEAPHEDKVCGEKVIVIKERLNNWEYTSFNAIYKYREHDLIKNDRYLFIHDTCTVMSRFNSKYEECRGLVFDAEEWLYTIRDRTFSNICMVSWKWISLIKDNFSVEMSKASGVSLEMGNKVHFDNHVTEPVVKFGKVYRSNRSRLFVAKKDLYGLGHPRNGQMYVQFGLVKWILWHKKGDFDGDIRDIWEHESEIPEEGNA